MAALLSASALWRSRPPSFPPPAYRGQFYVAADVADNDVGVELVGTVVLVQGGLQGFFLRLAFLCRKAINGGVSSRLLLRGAIITLLGAVAVTTLAMLLHGFILLFLR